MFQQNQRKLLYVQAAVAAVDVGVKLLVSVGVIDIGENIFLDERIIENILSFSGETLELSSMVYVAMMVLSWILPFAYNGI